MALKSYALTTAQRAADFMGLGTVTGAKATKLELLCNTVTEFIEKYIGYRVKLSTYTNEELDSYEGTEILLKHFPVVTFTSLQRRDSGLNEDDWETIDSDKYFVENSSGIITFPRGYMVHTSVRGWRATYTAGYDFDNSTVFLSDTEAGDIELAAWLLISSVYNRSKGGAGIESESIGDYSVKYKGAMFDNEDIKSLLERYARIEAMGPLTPVNT